jgi:mRNA interferase RelE/StbE
MNAVYYKQAVKTLEKLDTITKQRIKQGIINIPRGDIRKLKGHTELYRLRVGDWRVVFSYIDNNTVLIESIMPRGKAYRRL